MKKLSSKKFVTANTLNDITSPIVVNIDSSGSRSKIKRNSVGIKNLNLFKKESMNNLHLFNLQENNEVKKGLLESSILKEFVGDVIQKYNIDINGNSPATNIRRKTINKINILKRKATITNEGQNSNSKMLLTKQSSVDSSGVSNVSPQFYSSIEEDKNLDENFEKNNLFNLNDTNSSNKLKLLNVDDNTNSKDVTQFNTSYNMALSEENPSNRPKRKLKKFRNLYDSMSSDDYLSEDMEEGWIIEDNWLIKKTWDLIMMICILISCIMEPYIISFSIQTDAILFIETIIDICFILDLIVQFFSPFYKNKKQIRNSRTIAANYLQGWFAFDLISSFPSSLIYKAMENDPESLAILKLTRFYKILKWARLFKLIKMIKSGFVGKILSQFKINDDESVDRLFKFFIIFLIFSHITTCAWIFVGIMCNDYYGRSWLSYIKVENSKNIDVYMASYYYNLVTIFTIGYGDIHCETIPEMIYNVFFMSIGVFLFSFGVSSISQIFSRSSERQKIFTEKMKILEDINKNYDIPSELYSNVKRNLLNIKKVTIEKFELLDELPFALRKEVLLGIINVGVKDINFFKNQEKEFIILVLPMLRNITIAKNEILIGIGDFLEEMYIVKKGTLSLKLEKIYQNVEIAQISENNNFGEVFMFTGKHCEYCVTGKTRLCELFALKKSDFNRIKTTYNDIIVSFLDKGTIHLEKLEKIKTVVLELFNLGIKIKQIKYVIKKISFYYFIKQIDCFFENEEIGEVEDLILSNNTKELQIFLKTNMTEEDFKKCFRNFLKTSKSLLQNKSSLSYKKSNSDIKEPEETHTKNEMSSIINKIMSPRYRRKSVLAELQKRDFSNLTIKSSSIESKLEEGSSQIFNKKEKVSQINSNPSFNSSIFLSNAPTKKRNSTKIVSQKLKKLEKLENTNSSPKAVYNIYKCKNSFNQNFVIKNEKFENLSVTNNADIQINSTKIKHSLEISKNYSMCYNDSSLTIFESNVLPVILTQVSSSHLSDSFNSKELVLESKSEFNSTINKNEQSETANKMLAQLDDIFSLIKNFKK